MSAQTLRYSVRMAVAMHCGYDAQDLAEYRYQPTRTPCEVYTDPHGYDEFTATKGNRKPRGSNDYYFGHWEWERVASPHLPEGWNIWRAVRD